MATNRSRRRRKSGSSTTDHKWGQSEVRLSPVKNERAGGDGTQEKAEAAAIDLVGPFEEEAERNITRVVKQRRRSESGEVETASVESGSPGNRPPALPGATASARSDATGIGALVRPLRAARPEAQPAADAVDVGAAPEFEGADQPTPAGGQIIEGLAASMRPETADASKSAAAQAPAPEPAPPETTTPPQAAPPQAARAPMETSWEDDATSRYEFSEADLDEAAPAEARPSAPPPPLQGPAAATAPIAAVSARTEPPSPPPVATPPVVTQPDTAPAVPPEPSARKSQRVKLTLVGVAIAAMAAAGALFLNSDRAPVADTGTLKVESVPPGAEVVLYGRVLGHTPFALSGLAAGPMTLELRLANHQTAKQKLRLQANEQNLVSVYLAEDAPAEASDAAGDGSDAAKDRRRAQRRRRGRARRQATASTAANEADDEAELDDSGYEHTVYDDPPPGSAGDGTAEPGATENDPVGVGVADALLTDSLVAPEPKVSANGADSRPTTKTKTKTAKRAALVALSQPHPRYPLAAEAKGMEGWVRVAFVVKQDGSVSDVSVVESSPAKTFDRAAVTAVKRWRYQPRQEDGASPRRQRVKLRFEARK